MKTSVLVLLSLLITLKSQAQSPVFSWAKGMGGSGSDVGLSITTDAIGNTYVTGHYSNTVDFDPGPGVTNLTANGSRDIFIQKLDPNGNLLWVKQWVEMPMMLGNQRLRNQKPKPDTCSPVA